MPKTRKTESPPTNQGEGSKARGKSRARAGAPDVLYPKLEAEFKLGTEALTAAQAMEMLGWETEPDGTKWLDGEFMFVDMKDQRVRCPRNDHNRPFVREHARKLAYDILNRHWADSRNSQDGEDLTINGESIIIGRHGNVLSAQHRLVGLVFAHQLWENQPHWRDEGLWPSEPPSMECLVVYGVDESHKTTRTLDYVRPRDLSDVLYTEQGLFGKMKSSERVNMTRVLGNAVRTLWERTGARADAWSPYLSHSEALEFVDRHPRLSRFVKHIWELNRKRSRDAEGKLLPYPIRRYLGEGTAAGLYYLMACSSSTEDNYYHGKGARGHTEPGVEARLRNEKRLKWDNLGKATEFWTSLARGKYDGEISGALATISGLDASLEITPVQKLAVIIKLWLKVLADEPFVADDLVPRLLKGSSGRWEMGEVLTVGGIDRGREADRQAEDRRQEAAKRAPRRGEDDPAPEEGEEEDSAGGQSEEVEEIYEGADGQDQEIDEGVADPARSTGILAPTEEDGPAADDPTPEEIEAATREARERREEKKRKLLEGRARRKAAARKRRVAAGHNPALDDDTPDWDLIENAIGHINDIIDEHEEED